MEDQIMKLKIKFFSENISSIFTPLIIISLIVAMAGCKHNLIKPSKMSPGPIVKEQKEKRNFISIHGAVSDQDGKPLGGAHVHLLNSKTMTGKSGEFKLYIEDIGKTNRLVLNISKNGYADRFAILMPGHHFKNFQMVKASEISFDPRNDVTIVSEDTGPTGGCWTSVSKIDWTNAEYLQQHYTINSKGATEQYTPSPELAMALSIHDSPIPCSRGFAVSIPGNSFTVADGSLATDIVIATVNSISLTSTWQMPGDYSVQIPSGEPAYMLSYGAGQIRFRDVNGKELNLKKGSKCEISLPVDPLLLKNDTQTFPSQVPLLVFNEKNGMWEQEDMLDYDPSEFAYKGTVTHFSTFNADDVKNPPATLRLDARKIKGKVQYAKIGVTYYDNQPVYIEADSNLNPDHDYHLIYNLPPNTDMSITFMGANNTLVGMPNMATQSGDLETESLDVLLEYPYYASNKTYQLFYDPVPHLQNLYIGSRTSELHLRVSYDWNGWLDAPTPSDQDKIQLFHRSPDGSIDEIASLFRVNMGSDFGDFDFNNQNNPELFTPGEHRFFVRATIFNVDGSLVVEYHQSPNSNEVYNTLAETPIGDVVINNFIHLPVSEVRISLDGGISWSDSYGGILAWETGTLTNVPQNNQTRIKIITSYWSDFYNQHYTIRDQDWTYRAVINVTDPWPDLIVGYTWSGYDIYGIFWQMQFFSDLTFRHRNQPRNRSFSGWTTENYSLNRTYPSSYVFTAGGKELTFYLEHPATHELSKMHWTGRSVVMSPN